MATYKDDLDILKAAEKADTNKLTFNAITELDNKGLLGRYGGEGGGGGDMWPGVPFILLSDPSSEDIPHEELPEWLSNFIEDTVTVQKLETLKWDLDLYKEIESYDGMVFAVIYEVGAQMNFVPPTAVFDHHQVFFEPSIGEDYVCISIGASALVLVSPDGDAYYVSGGK